MLKLLRKSLSFVFGIQAFGLTPVLPFVAFQLQRHPMTNPNFHVSALLWGCAVISILGGLFGVASWGLKKDKRYARSWGLAASCINLALSYPLLRYVRLSSLGFAWILPISGVVGIIALWRPWTNGGGAANPAPVQGDGTGTVPNIVAWIVSTIGGAGGYFWWGHWTHANNIPRSTGWAFYAQLFLILMISIALHEAGHLAIGWGLGLKIRGFAVGPLQWRIRDGKWEFRFDAKAFLSLGGSASMAPPNAEEDRGREIGMILAGPLANILTGMVAFGLALPIAGETPSRAQGIFMLFGLTSVVAALYNLIPFRNNEQYSDGARLYQILAGGPVAEMHRVFSVVASSTVTPLRSREFDIRSIHRAATGVAQGRQAMFLRLFAYQYYLDNGKMAEAAREINLAEEIYTKSAVDLPAELHTTFIFANAYVMQDAAGARHWWDRMESKKPGRRNGDYWLAHSALNWIEGNQGEAEESWQKGNELAQKLPQAGAYEFDRHCFALLRRAMDQAQMAFSGLEENAQRFA